MNIKRINEISVSSFFFAEQWFRLFLCYWKYLLRLNHLYKFKMQMRNNWNSVVGQIEQKGHYFLTFHILVLKYVWSCISIQFHRFFIIILWSYWLSSLRRRNTKLDILRKNWILWIDTVLSHKKFGHQFRNWNVENSKLPQMSVT